MAQPPKLRSTSHTNPFWSLIVEASQWQHLLVMCRSWPEVSHSPAHSLFMCSDYLASKQLSVPRDREAQKLLHVVASPP